MEQHEGSGQTKNEAKVKKTIAIEHLHAHPENNIFEDLGVEALRQLVEDIREHGILHDILVRPIGEEAYEILSGHQRVRAIKQLGWTHVNADVVEVGDNEATHCLISANTKVRQLSSIEWIRSVRRERELIEEEYGRRQGQRSDLTLDQDGPKFPGRWTEKVAEKLEISERKVRRYDALDRALNQLILPLQQMVTDGTLSAAAGAQLAQLSTDEQKRMVDVIGTKIGEIKVADLKRLKKEYELKDKMHEQAKVELEAKRQEVTEMQGRVAALRGEVSILSYEIQSFGNMRQMGEEFRQNLPQYQALHRKSAELERKIAEQEAEIAKREEAIANTEHIVEYVETPVEVPPQDYEAIKADLAEKNHQLAAILNEVPQREEQARAEQTARLLAEQVAAQADRLVETVAQMPVPPEVIETCCQRLETAAQQLHELATTAQA